MEENDERNNQKEKKKMRFCIPWMFLRHSAARPELKGYKVSSRSGHQTIELLIMQIDISTNST